jgi:CRP-like cAMP-binding protein
VDSETGGAAVDALGRVPLFAELDAAELRALAASMRDRTFSAGETVTAEGDPGDGFFVVVRGEAEVTVGGEPRGSLGPGDHFGEIALLTGSARTATVTAAGDLACRVLTPVDFRALVEGDAAIAWKLLQSMAQRLG